MIHQLEYRKGKGEVSSRNASSELPPSTQTCSMEGNAEVLKETRAVSWEWELKTKAEGGVEQYSKRSKER